MAPFSTQTLKVNSQYPEPEFIRIAALLIRRGELVAFPTETVYGLGALAFDSDKVEKIFLAKGRPKNHPLIVHVDGVEMAKTVSRVWPEIASILADAFWPGPLTIILPKHSNVPTLVSAGLDTVAIRAPSHPIAQALIKEVGAPIAAPSANRYTEISSTTADHVSKGLSDRISLILDGGLSHLGMESTVLDLSSPVPTILRPGSILPSQIEKKIGRVAVLEEALRQQDIHISPGMSQKHYAPKALVTIIGLEDSGMLTDRILRVLHSKSRVGLLLHRLNPPDRPGIVCQKIPSAPEYYGQFFYHALHELENAGCTHIIIEDVPAEEEWKAVKDRMTRASAKED